MPFFTPTSCRAVRVAGQDAAWALLAQILLVPTVLAWIEHRGNIAFNFEVADLALAAFLVFAAAVGRVLAVPRPDGDILPSAAPETWLLRVGWQRGGTAPSVFEVPSSRTA